MKPPRSPADRLRVCIVPEYPLNLMVGGLQVQAVETLEAVAARDETIACEMFDWSSRQPPADVYHFIGFPPHMARVAELVTASGKPWLVSLLLGAPSAGTVKMATARSWLRAAVTRGHSLRTVLQRAHKVITITPADLAAAGQIYGLDSRRMAIVPHGVAPGFFHRDPGPWSAKRGKDPFVLCVGAIQPRKNQLLLAQACNALRLPLVLIGPVLAENRPYADQVAAEMVRNESLGGQWIRGLERSDPLLVAAHHACRLFALLSTEETQPISVLQAMAASRPILLLRSGYTRQAPFSQLPCASSGRLDAVKAALHQAWDNAKASQLSEDFSWPSVAGKLAELYRSAAETQPQP